LTLIGATRDKLASAGPRGDRATPGPKATPLSAWGSFCDPLSGVAGLVLVVLATILGWSVGWVLATFFVL
jgi:hypothetical protein